MASCGVPALDELLAGGYPRKSAILVEGQSGNEGDILAYMFIQSGLKHGDFCAYVTRLLPSEVITDARAFDVDFASPGPRWMSPEDGDRIYSPNDLATISFGIKDIMKGQESRLSRVAFDGLSQLLMLHSADSVYRFVSQLLPEMKKRDVVLLATIQTAMHQPQVLSAIELLFDGIIEIGRTGQGELQVNVKKMRGTDALSRSSQLLLASRGASPVSSKPRVAVLPFTNISPDPNDEYVSDGLTEELITTLSRINGLEVIARTSVMRYKGSQKSLTEVSRELGVGTILEGSTRRAGNKLRVAVQMIDAQHERHLWSQSYDRELADLFAIQTEISEKVAENVKLKMGMGSIATPASPIGNSVAYDYYLRGRHRLNSGTQGLEEALHFFTLAIEKDPKLARAYSGLSDYYSYIADDLMSSAEAYPIAKKYAEEALSLDPDLSDAHASLALIAFLYDWEWPAAEKHFTDSIRLSPNNAFALHWYGLFLKSMGRFDEALASMEKARELDPFSDSIIFSEAVVYWCKKMHEPAVDRCKKALELNRENAAAHVLLGILCLERQDVASARLEAKEAEKARGDKGAQGLNGYLFGKLGDIEDARRVLMALQSELIVDPFTVSQVLLGLGDKRAAVEEFQKAVSGHSSYLPIFNRNSNMDEMQSVPGYMETVAKAKLA